MRKTRVRKLRAMLVAAGNTIPTQSDVRQAKRAYVAFRGQQSFRRNAGAITADMMPRYR